MSNKGWGGYCEEAGHEKGTNQKCKVHTVSMMRLRGGAGEIECM